MCEISAYFTSSEFLHVSGIVLGIANSHAESDTAIDLEVFTSLEIKKKQIITYIFQVEIFTR